MSRRLLLGGAGAVVLAIIWGALAGDRLMLSWLVAWLVVAALPFGATVMLLAIDLCGGSAVECRPALQRLALGAPLAAVMFVPLLIGHGFYPWAHGAAPGAPFGRWWMQGEGFVLRALVMLVILGALALRAALTPQHGAGGLAALFVAGLVGTLAADDWVMSLVPTLHSGAFGLLVISGQCAVALAAAVLLGWAAGAVPRAGVALLAAASAVWGWLHFMQFLVMWSGDLPAEAAWYLTRDDGGRGVEWFVGLAGFGLPLGLVAMSPRRRERALPLVAGLVIIAHAFEMLWLVTPALRGHFVVTVPDGLMLVGLLGLAAWLAMVVRLRGMVPARVDRAVV